MKKQIDGFMPKFVGYFQVNFLMLYEGKQN
jgi:hypothetical protein